MKTHIFTFQYVFNACLISHILKQATIDGEDDMSIAPKTKRTVSYEKSRQYICYTQVEILLQFQK